MLKRPHRRKRDEPLVAISGPRVRAAIEWKGMSINRAAGSMKVSQQTLDSIVRGQTSRCHQSLRDKLATLLELPATWLGGEGDLLPNLTPWLPLPELGYQPPLWVDENMRIIRPPEGGDLMQRTGLPPRYQLAAYEICQEIASAWKRDIEAGDREAKAALSRLAEGRWKKNPWGRATMLMTRLISGFWWRRLFLKGTALPAAVDPKQFTDAEWRALSEKMMTENQRKTAEQLEANDQFAAAAARALSTVLRPWFAGVQELDYEVLIGVLEWASAGFGKNPSLGGT